MDTTDPLLLYPMILRIQTPAGLVDFGGAEPALDALQAEEVRASELRTLLSGLGAFAVAQRSTAHRLTLQSGPTNALPYAQARFLRALRVGSVCQITENYTDRYTLTVWQNCVLSAPPRVPHWGGGEGEEYAGFGLEFIHVEDE